MNLLDLKGFSLKLSPSHDFPQYTTTATTKPNHAMPLHNNWSCQKHCPTCRRRSASSPVSAKMLASVFCTMKSMERWRKSRVTNAKSITKITHTHTRRNERTILVIDFGQEGKERANVCARTHMRRERERARARERERSNECLADHLPTSSNSAALTN